MLTIDTLKAFGANTGEGLGRCFGKEDFYLRLVSMGLADANFDRLEAAIDAGEARQAFEAAHALKGSLGNLAITPIYEPVCRLTELLRGKNEIEADCEALLEEIMAQLKKARAL